MKKSLSIALTIFLFTSVFSLSAIAQDNERNWDNGAIVAVTEVHIKPGMFNAYVNDLNNVWRQFNEAQMADGSILSYGMYANAAPRAGEPDLYLTVTYKNWATFDLGEEYFASIRDKIMGSAEAMRSAGIKRGDLRTIGDQYNLVEIKFRE